MCAILICRGSSVHPPFTARQGRGSYQDLGTNTAVVLAGPSEKKKPIKGELDIVGGGPAPAVHKARRIQEVGFAKAGARDKPTSAKGSMWEHGLSNSAPQDSVLALDKNPEQRTVQQQHHINHPPLPEVSQCANDKNIPFAYSLWSHNPSLRRRKSPAW